MKKRFLAFLLAVCVAVSMLVLPASAGGSNAAVQTATALGGLTAEQAGSLGAPLTRGQAARLLTAFSAYRDTTTAQGRTGRLYSDVDSDSPYAVYIRTAVQNGWMTGYSDGSFRPDNTVTLEEACTAVLKLLGYKMTDLNGAFPAAQLNKAQELGLRSQLYRAQGQTMNFEDCAMLLYNALSAITASGGAYGSTLGFTVANGQVDTSTVLLSSLKGPFVASEGTQLPFAGGNNFRELGGYEADEGKHVRWGQIYRGIPTGLLTSDADRKLLDSLGLRLILDLRSEQEAEKMPDYVPDGARLVRICELCLDGGKEVDFSPEDREKLLEGKPDEGRRMADAMYKQMLFGNKAYKELFRALEAGETPVLFHCSGGKDRTGVAAMLILLALGASDETIYADFVQTNECRRPELEKIWAEHAEEIAARPEQKKFYQGIAGVHPESVELVLSTIRSRCGSADAYLEAEYGLTPARLMRLRRMYLE